MVYIFWSFLARLFVYAVFAWLVYSIVLVLQDYSKYEENVRKGDQNAQLFLKTREEPFNLVGMIILLSLVFVMINIKVGFAFDGTEGDLPGIIMAALPASLGLFIWIFNLIHKWLGIKKVRRYGLPNEQEEVTLATQIRIDIKRKFYHVFIFGLIVVFLFLGYFLLLRNGQAAFDQDVYETLIANYWGSTDGLGYLQIAFIRHSLPFAQTLTVLFMYGAMILLLTTDITRLSKKILFILQKESQSIMRYKEIDTLASYTHFAVGYLLCAMILPPIFFLAALCLGSFADPAASIIGMKFGKKRYRWNQKSFEGTLAGSIIAFLSLFVFVGPFYALSGMLVFLFIDLFTPEPVKLSDNLLMPVAITLVFILLSLFHVPATNIFGF